LIASGFLPNAQTEMAMVKAIRQRIAIPAKRSPALLYQARFSTFMTVLFAL